MKTNPLLASLVGFLCLSALLTIVLAARHFFAVVELQKLQAQTATITTTLNYAQSLANEAILYSQRNPAITSVLERFKMRTTATPNPASMAPPSALAPATSTP